MANPYQILQDSIIETMEQGLDLLGAITDSDYTRKHPLAFHASIGGHYRHSLEHFEPLLQEDTSIIDYDARPRDNRLETNRIHAAARTVELIAASRQLTKFASPVHVRCRVSFSGDDSPLVSSTYEREAMYAIAHAIHHYALIAVMCNLMRVTLPESFGIAPSTVVHQKDRKQGPMHGIKVGALRPILHTAT